LLTKPVLDRLLIKSILKGWKQFFTKIEFSHKGTKTQRKMRSIFLIRAFAPLWLTSFRSEAEKNLLVVIGTELIFYSV
jgi:hypothetical protein